MGTTLFAAFHKYLVGFQGIVQQSESKKAKGHLRLVANETRQLFDLVDKVEGQRDFQDLLINTQSEFSNDDELNYGLNMKNQLASRNKRAIKNFFRNSSSYIDLFYGKKIDIKELFTSYCEEFKRQDYYDVKLLAMMEFVKFTEESMDFGSFQIRRFTTEELSAVLRNEINKIFYPKAYIDVNELDKLKDYWFIYLSAPPSALKPSNGIPLAPQEKVGASPGSGMRIGPAYVGIKSTEYPKPLETILKYLTLFKWEKKWEKPPNGWIATSHGFTFNIPLILQVDESLLTTPKTIADIPPLETILGYTSEDPNKPIEKPAVRFNLDSSDTAKFKKFITDVKNILNNLKIEEKNEWRFLDIAQGFLVKAFFSEGLEQLLWHITVIEALLGENGEGVIARLANRIATILGTTKEEKKKIRKLYDFRSALVHGRKSKEQADPEHLHSARDLARRTLYWFLHYLDNFQPGISQGQLNEKIPAREDLLRLIDLNEESRNHMRWMIDKIPKEFPNIPEWKD